MDLLNIKKLEVISSRRSLYNYERINVLGYDKNLNKVFEGNIVEARSFLKSKSINKNIVPLNAIFKSAAGYRPKVEGIIWKFKDNDDKSQYNIFYSSEASKKFLMIKDNSKPIVAFDDTGTPIKGFENVLKALKWLKDSIEDNRESLIYDDRAHDYISIINVARQKNKKVVKAAGYRWRFYEDVKE